MRVIGPNAQFCYTHFMDRLWLAQEPTNPPKLAHLDSSLHGNHNIVSVVGSAKHRTQFEQWNSFHGITQFVMFYQQNHSKPSIQLININFQGRAADFENYYTSYFLSCRSLKTKISTNFMGFTSFTIHFPIKHTHIYIYNII